MRLETIDFLGQTTTTKPVTETPVGKKIKEAKDKIVVAKDTIKTTPIKEPFLKLKTQFKGLAQAPEYEAYIVPTQGNNYFNKEKVRVEGNYELALLDTLGKVGFDVSGIKEINQKLNVNFDKAPDVKIDITIPKITSPTIDFLTLVKSITATVQVTLEWSGQADVGGKWQMHTWADTYTFTGNYEQIGKEIERVSNELIALKDYFSHWYERKRNHFTLGYQTKYTVAIMERGQTDDWKGMTTLRFWVWNNGKIIKVLKDALLEIVTKAVSTIGTRYTNTIAEINKIIDDINTRVIPSKQNEITKKINDYNSYLTKVATEIRNIVIKTRDDSLAKLTSSLTTAFSLLDESQQNLIDALNLLVSLLNSLKEIYALVSKIDVSQVPDMDVQELINKIKSSITNLQTNIEKKLSDLETAITQIAQAVGV